MAASDEDGTRLRSSQSLPAGDPGSLGVRGVEVSRPVRIGELKAMGDRSLLIETLGTGSDVSRVR